MDYKHSSISGYSIVGNKRDKILVSMNSSGVLILDGCYHIRVIFGTVKILGYCLDEQETAPVFSAHHRAFIPVIPLTTKKIEDHDVDALNLCYKLSHEQCKELNFKVGSSAVLIELLPYISNLSHLLSQTSHESLYMDTLPHLRNETFIPSKESITSPFETKENVSPSCDAEDPLSPSNKAEASQLSGDEIKMVKDFKTILRGVKPILPSMGEFPVLNISIACAEFAEELAKNIHIFGTDVIIRTRVMIIGEKNVGKTSFLMYLLNTLLSKYRKSVNMKKENPNNNTPSSSETSNKINETPEICCLDLDPGQPIQSTPGVLSMKFYSKPLVGPAYTYSVKSAGFKSKKIKLIKSDKRIGDKKRTKEVNASVKRLQKKQTNKLSHSSIFLAMNNMDRFYVNKKKSEKGLKDSEMFLGNVNPSECSLDLVGIAQKFTKTYFESHKNVPMVVNTMGWIRGEGKNILANLIKFIKPTHIIHLGSSEDQKQSFSYEDLVQYIAHGKYHSFTLRPNQKNIEAKLQDSYSIRNFRYWPVDSTVKKSLPPTLETLPNPNSVDLRNLMLYSYFSSMWSLQNKSFVRSSCKQSVSIDYRQIGVKDMFSDYKAKNPPQSYVNSMFALCSIDESYLVNQGEYCPKRVRLPGWLTGETTDIMALDSLMQFKGWCIVVGVDTKTFTFSLVTPRSDNLKGVNVLVRSKVSLPQDFINFLR